MENYINISKFNKYLLFFFLAHLFPFPVFGKTIDIYPNHRIKKEKSLSAFFQIRWTDVSPGDTILLYDDYGPYREPFIILGKGTHEKPIIIKAADGENPVIKSSVIFTNAANIIFENITVSDHFERGIIIREESNNITIKNCVVKNNGLGIWIGGHAGINNKIISNEIFSNETHGIAIDVVNCKEGSETLIAENRVYNNGHHGMEINGSYYIIEKNEVFNNGLKHLGCTGIHTYARDAEQDAGDHNIIRYNVCYRNRDTKKFDGNGIQLDQWCDYNEVYYNICYENDGAGICVFDSSNSRVYNNTLFNNAIDSGKSHQIKAELVIASDFTKNVDHTNNISVFNNIIAANNKNVYAIYVDRLTSDNKLSINNNLFYNLKADKFYIWNDREVRDINKVKSRNAKINDNLSDNPLFIKKIPAEINSFRLQKNSPCIGKGIYTGQKKDILGQIISREKNPSLGAIHHNSGEF
ncbi:MAG: right-handed parallel beta-helix repeat-containing protein [bacterium]|nr:right-handed parallel beta-helix repeat-containing protein [bacterium]